jgi:hypothetical protein
LKAILPSLAVVLGFVTVVSGQAPIRASAAGAYVGRVVTIEDTVAQVSHEPQSGFTYLNFGGPFPTHISASSSPTRSARSWPPQF